MMTSSPVLTPLTQRDHVHTAHVARGTVVLPSRPFTQRGVMTVGILGYPSVQLPVCVDEERLTAYYSDMRVEQTDRGFTRRAAYITICSECLHEVLPVEEHASRHLLATCSSTGTHAILFKLRLGQGRKALRWSLDFTSLSAAAAIRCAFERRHDGWSHISEAAAATCRDRFALNSHAHTLGVARLFRFVGPTPARVALGPCIDEVAARLGTKRGG